MRRTRASDVASAIAAASLAGCNRVQSSLAPAGDQAMAIHDIWTLMLWICVPVYLLVLAALWYALARGRGGGQAGAGDRGIEHGLLAWTLVIAALLTILTAASYAVDRRLHAQPLRPLDVRVTARQWWWEVEYLGAAPAMHVVTANELFLPVDRPARVQLRSADVIHSLWIPALNGKEDLIPGRPNEIVMTPRKAGYYRGQCAEFCGLQHAHMALDVQVVSTHAFAHWRQAQLASAPPPLTPLAQDGQHVFLSHACVTCHAIRGTPAGGVTGPDLTHFASRRTLAAGALSMDRASLKRWLADPQAVKPGTDMPAVPLAPDELAAITEYLMELR